MSFIVAFHEENAEWLLQVISQNLNNEHERQKESLKILPPNLILSPENTPKNVKIQHTIRAKAVTVVA